MAKTPARRYDELKQKMLALNEAYLEAERNAAAVRVFREHRATQLAADLPVLATPPTYPQALVDRARSLGIQVDRISRLLSEHDGHPAKAAASQ